MTSLKEKESIVSGLYRSLERIEKELEVSIEIQKKFMPQESEIQTIKDDYKIDIKSYYKPFSELGGDLWGIKRLSDHQVAIYLIDLIGHGIPAAFNGIRLHTLLSIYPFSFFDLSNLFKELNHSLFEHLERGQFATMFYCIIDNHENTLSYITAGAPLPFLIKGKEGTLQELPGSGLPLGAVRDASYHSFKTSFEPQDVLLIYSDAFIETPSTEGKVLKDQGISSDLNPKWTAEENLKSLLNKFNSSYTPQLEDDLTLIVVKFNQDSSFSESS